MRLKYAENEIKERTEVGLKINDYTFKIVGAVLSHREFLQLSIHPLEK